MNSLESIVRNYREGVFQTTSPYIIYYDYFGEILNTDENGLPYGYKLVDAKSESVDEAYQ